MSRKNKKKKLKKRVDRFYEIVARVYQIPVHYLKGGNND